MRAVLGWLHVRTPRRQEEPEEISVHRTAAAAGRVAGAGRKFIGGFAGGGEDGQLFAELLGSAVRARRAFPVGGTDENLAVTVTVSTVKFVYWHADIIAGFCEPQRAQRAHRILMGYQAGWLQGSITSILLHDRRQDSGNPYGRFIREQLGGATTVYAIRSINIDRCGPNRDRRSWLRRRSFGPSDDV